MTQNDPRLPWTDEQMARANRVIQEEAARARVAATFLPLCGPLPPDTDFVRRQQIELDQVNGLEAVAVDDKETIRLTTLQVRVALRGAQVADPEMTSALLLFRRAANILARLEDELVFRGQFAESYRPLSPDQTLNDDDYLKEGPKSKAEPPPRLADGCELKGGQRIDGLVRRGAKDNRIPLEDPGPGKLVHPDILVNGVSEAIGKLEHAGQFGPFATVLDQKLFLAAQTPIPGSLVLPQDRIIPFLGGGPLLRSSTLPGSTGVVVALGGAPIELVIATDVSLNFLEVTSEPMYVFRVYEKMILRIKQREAIARLWIEPPPSKGSTDETEEIDIQVPKDPPSKKPPSP